MKELERVRVNHRIYVANGDLIGDHKTINAAKRESRSWQKATGVMGDGRMRVAEKAPAKEVP
jgi:hypothetical protein